MKIWVRRVPDTGPIRSALARWETSRPVIGKRIEIETRLQGLRAREEVTA